MKSKILLIDDEVQLCQLMKMSIEAMGYSCDYCHSVDKAISKLSEKKFNAIITDLNLGAGGNGNDLVKYVAQNHPEIPIVVLTAYGSKTASVESLKLGAFDFTSKPIDDEQLKAILTNCIVNGNAQQNYKDGLVSKSILGESKPIQELKKKIIRFSQGQAPVFLHGESGVGKEVVARTIHELSNRSSGPFVPINCGAIPAALLESEFFGFKKGSFTGAVQDKTGLIHLAHGGTIFLDEIAELSMEMQVKLLRVLQEKTIRPIGSDKEIFVDFRVICATHQDLPKLIQEGKFRQDLFYRLFVMSLSIPPLRERGKDILLLAEEFKNNTCDKWSFQRKTFSNDVKNWLMRQTYHGNVRELQNIVERLVALSESNTITIEDVLEGDSNAIMAKATLIAKPNDSQPVNLNGSNEFNMELGLDTYMENIEKEAITQALKQTDNNIKNAASLLRIEVRALRYRLSKYDMETDRK